MKLNEWSRLEFESKRKVLWDEKSFLFHRIEWRNSKIWFDIFYSKKVGMQGGVKMALGRLDELSS